MGSARHRVRTAWVGAVTATGYRHAGGTIGCGHPGPPWPPIAGAPERLPCADARASAPEPHARAARLQRGGAAARRRSTSCSATSAARARARGRRPRPPSWAPGTCSSWTMAPTTTPPRSSRHARRRGPGPTAAAPRLRVLRRRTAARARPSAPASSRRRATWWCSPTRTWPRRPTSCRCSTDALADHDVALGSRVQPDGTRPARQPAVPPAHAGQGLPRPRRRLGHGPGARLPVRLQGLPTRRRPGPVRAPAASPASCSTPRSSTSPDGAATRIAIVPVQWTDKRGSRMRVRPDARPPGAVGPGAHPAHPSRGPAAAARRPPWCRLGTDAPVAPSVPATPGSARRRAVR